MTAQDLKNSILQLAMQGKLVEQRAEEGTARELIEQIELEKVRLIKERKLKKEKPLPKITEEEIPFKIPESWEWVRWGNMANSIQYGYNAPSAPQGDIRIVRISDIQNNMVNWSAVPYCQISEKEIPMYLLSENDLLFARTGGTVGKSYLVTNLTERAIFAGYLIRSNYNKRLCPKYLKYFMESPLYWSQLQSGITQTAQPNCNGKTLSKMIIPIPPIEEQKRIVEKIDELFPYIELYEKAYSKLEVLDKNFSEDLHKSILQYAMQGKLVEQKSEEGTGEELYCQIQAAKKKLIKAGVIKKEKLLPEISEAEKPFDIPTSWKWVRLAEICEQKPVNGYSPKNVDYITEVKKLTLTATTAGYFKPDAFKYVDVEKDKVSQYWLKHNDLLIQRSNSRELVGTSCIYTGKDDEYIYPDLMMRMRIMQGVELVYLDYALKSPATRFYFSQKASGTSSSMPKIAQDIVANTLIPLPPLQEQKRIVNELKKIIPYCEKLYMRFT